METRQKDFLRVLAFVYIRHMKYEKAVVLLKAMRELMPEDTYTLRSLSYVHYLTGDYEAALNEIDLAFDPMKTASQLKTFYLLKSKILWALDKKEEAREHLNYFLKEITQP